MHRQIAGRLTGPVTKWVVVAAWLLITMVLGSFAGQLTSVQKNDASSWVPGSAESTKGLNRLDQVKHKNDITATVVYFRAGGLTPSDFAAIGQQAQRLGGIKGVTTGPDGRPSVVAPASAEITLTTSSREVDSPTRPLMASCR